MATRGWVSRRRRSGINQLKCPALAPPFCPAAGDPARYGSLAHPGDSYSYDMFSQAGQAVLDDPDVLGGLMPERLIGFGESQSAGRLVTYIDAVHPLVDVYDGYFVYSRGAAGAALSQGLGLPSAAPVAPTRIRDDLDVPVLVFQTENDTGGLQARQPDSDLYRLWEVAGTSHFDQYGLSTGRTDVGERESVEEWFDFMQHPTNQPNPTFTCNSPINTGPATFVLRAAMAHLNRWIADGTLPPVAPRLDTTGSPYALDPVTGNVLRWRPHARGGRARRQAQRLRPDRPAVLRAVRHHDAVHTRPARRALPQPRRVRLALEPGDQGRARGRLHRPRGRAAPAGGRCPLRHPLIQEGAA